jgi:hypothetical protein
MFYHLDETTDANLIVWPAVFNRGPRPIRVTMKLASFWKTSARSRLWLTFPLRKLNGPQPMILSVSWGELDNEDKRAVQARKSNT